MNSGLYKDIKLLRQNGVYQWSQACKIDSKQLVMLQLLQLPLSRTALSQVHQYYQAVQSIKRPYLWSPTEVISTEEHPLLAVYPYCEVQALLSALPANPHEALPLWSQAVDAVHCLHNQDLIHGNLSLSSFVLCNSSVLLTDIGYAPLLQVDQEQAVHECYAVLAPEVKEHKKISTAADIYSFALMIGQWMPELQRSSWYDTATSVQPENRFSSIRVMFEALQETLNQFTNNPPSSRSVTKTTTQSYDSNLVPLYSLTIKIEPSEAACFETNNSRNLYRKDEVATVKLTPHADWKFDSWSGDVKSSSEVISVIMDGDKSLKAYLTRSSIYDKDKVSVFDRLKSIVEREECEQQEKPKSLPWESRCKLNGSNKIRVTVIPDPPRSPLKVLKPGIQRYAILLSAVLVPSLTIVSIYLYNQLQYSKKLNQANIEVERVRTDKADRKFSDCITQAQKLIGESNDLAEIQAVADNLLQECRLALAKQKMSGRKYKDAMKNIIEIPQDSSSFQEAETLIKKWSIDILAEAKTFYEIQGKLQEAIELIGIIPKNSPIYKDAQEKAKRWEKNHQINQERIQTAQKAFNEGQLQTALDLAKQVSNLPYWQKQAKPIIDKATAVIAARIAQERANEFPPPFNSLPDQRPAYSPPGSYAPRYQPPIYTPPRSSSRPSYRVPQNSSPACGGGQC